MKEWTDDKKHTLEILDEFLENHKQEKYKFSQIILLAEDEHFSNFKTTKFQEIADYTRELHEESERKFREEQMMGESSEDDDL